jgi:hypothetical protein
MGATAFFVGASGAKRAARLVAERLLQSPNFFCRKSLKTGAR